MGITPRSIHDKDTWVFSHGLCKRLRTFLYDNVSPPCFARESGV